MSRFFKILSVIFVIVLYGNNIKSQEVSAKLDSFQIEIGNQVYFHLSAKLNKNQFVKFPDFKNNIIDGIEIIERTGIDTIQLQDGKLNLKQSFLITSFEDSLYNIPQFLFIIDKDTLYTKSIMFDVQMMKGIDSAFVSKIDTNQVLRIFDVKAPIDTPLTFEEFIKIYYPYIIGFIVLLLIAFFVWYYIKKRKENQPLIKFEKPKEPAHLIAFRELEKLKEKKLWQSGKEKQYYSELTDIIREYIYNRYNILTFEKTSHQLLENIKYSNVIDNERYIDLSRILNLADLAKFAKYKPLPDENDLSIKNAIIFVEKTLKEEIKEENTSSDIIEEIVNENKKENIDNKNK